jgi:hypothetical protein
VPYHNLPPITSRSGIKKGGVLKRSRSAEKRENQESRCINSNEMNQALSEAVEYLNSSIRSFDKLISLNMYASLLSLNLVGVEQHMPGFSPEPKCDSTSPSELLVPQNKELV